MRGGFFGMGTKKLLAFLLSVVMVLSCIPAMAFAAEEVTTSDGKALTATVEVATTEASYTIKFTADTEVADVTGTIEQPTEESTTNASFTFTLPAVPEKTGFTANGWKNGENVFEAGDITAIVAKGNNVVITFTADYTEETATEYTITFNANGGTVTPESATTKNGVVTLPTPTREGYKFVGWAKTASATAADVTATTKFTADTTIYAVWEAETVEEPTFDVTVKFNANGGTGTMADQVETGLKIEANATSATFTLNANTFEKENSLFKGWATSADGEVVYADGQTVEVTEATTLTLYAVWEEVGATTLIVDVVFGHGLGNKQITLENKATTGDKLTYAQIMEALGLDAEPTVEEYSFIGWSNEVLVTDKANLVTAADAEKTIAVSKESNIIYAQWSAIITAPTISDQAAQDAVNEIVNDANSVLNDVDKNIEVNKSMADAIDMSAYEGEKVTVTLDISIKTVASNEAGNVSITFDVKPMANGTQINNTAIKKDIVFFLPIPTVMKDNAVANKLGYLWANITHSDDTREIKKAVLGDEKFVEIALGKFSEVELTAPQESYTVVVKSAEDKNVSKEFTLNAVEGNYTELLNAVKKDADFKVSKKVIKDITVDKNETNAFIEDKTINVVADGAVLVANYKKKASSDDTSTSSGGGGGGGSSVGSTPVVSVKDADGKNMSTRCVTYSATDKTATIKAPVGYEIADVILNGKSLGVVTKVEDVTKKDKIEVILKVAGEETPSTNPEQPSTETPSTTPQFVDVSGHWAASYISRAVELGLFSGTSTTTFSPDAKMTRGMIAAVLYRMSGETFTGSANFSDVAANAYYNNAVAWGAEKGIIAGVGNGMFAPDSEITREQMAVLIYNYAKYAGIETSTTTLNFTDNASISSWANEAVAYCVNAGIISGRTDGSFDPQGTATRAEVASILVRFIDK